MKGVSEADIAAATGNPALMKQLVIQNYGRDRPGFPPSNDRYLANNPIQLNDPSRLLAGLGPDPSPSPPLGPSPPSQQAGITSDESSYCRTMHNICVRQCEGMLRGLDPFGPFRACIRTCMHNAGCLDF